MVDLSGIKILLADDEGDLRAVIRLHLQNLGATVLTAQDGNEASTMLKTQRFDLIISDVRMPTKDGDGMSFLKRVRKISNPPPFLFITGFSDYSDNSALREGAFSILTKPFSMNHLTGEIAKALNLKT